MGKKKPFVDKKKSSTYHLLHRSQRDVAQDVLSANELQEGDTAASGMVLYPSDNNLESTNQAVLTTRQQASTMTAWREKLSKAGLLLDETESERYLKSISGTGTFLDARGRVSGNALVEDARSRVFQEEEETTNNVLEVERQLDSIPLTSECMDDEIAEALFGDFDADDYEELNDDFMLDAAKEPEAEGDADAKEKAFDYDEHIRKLMSQAKREREGRVEQSAAAGHKWGNQDSEFFSGLRPLHEQEEEDFDDFSHENNNNVTPGVVPALNPEQERALCDKFAETLAEYDSDEVGDCPEEEIVGPRPMQGDAQVEAALEDFLYDREDQVFMQGSRHYLHGIKHGGSGFSALVGKQMVHAKDLKNGKVVQQQEEEEPVVEPVQKVLADAKERLALAPVNPPPEEILIDGKSYFSQKEVNPFDCESVLSTYSNLDNNPVTIQATRLRRHRKNKQKNRSVTPILQQEEEEPVQPIRLSNKTGLPIGVVPTRRGQNANNDNDYFDNDDTIASVNKGFKRNKKETAAEKKARKAAVQLERQMARIQKRATREVFKEEFQKRSMEVGVDDVAGKSVFRYT